MILRQRDIDFIEENSSQDPAGHILVAPLITHPASRNFWRDIGSVGHSITAPLLTKQDSKKYWQEMRESVANFSWDFFTKPNILLTEDEQNAIVIECQSPKKDRVDSVQNNTLPNERGNIPLNEWVWQPSVSPPTEKMNRHDQETRRWEAHINLLLEAGTQAIKHGRVNDMPNPESLLEEMMQYGREQLEEECKQQ
jgi:hypothetical protein